MKRFFNLAACAAALCGLCNAASGNDYWYGNAQREQIHQQYLSSVEHQALHQGLSSGYGAGYGSYATPTNLPYGSGYGVGYGFGQPAYGSSYGVQPYNYGRTRTNCGATQYRTPIFNGGRLW